VPAQTANGATFARSSRRQLEGLAALDADDSHSRRRPLASRAAEHPAPDDTRHNFDMDAGAARELAAALVERADAGDLAVDSPV
jgi:hypothetical protein